MPDVEPQPVDLLVVGTGIAGLWIVDAAHRSGRTVVAAEAFESGRGQSVSAQGIIHGGLKYTLREKDVAAAGAIRDMPASWLQLHDAPDAEGPDLRSASVSCPCTWIWRTDRLASRIGMLGARAVLRTRPENVPASERPAILENTPGPVLRVPEPVFDTVSVLEALSAPHADRIVAVDGPEGLEFNSRGGEIDLVTLRSGEGEVCVRPAAVVFAAGAGNEGLLSRLGLDAGIAQRRPLHMTLLRGRDLPVLHGHCVDGNRTRVTITSAHDDEHVVWQIGGELAESGVERDPGAQIARAREELRAVLPDLDLDRITDAAWATYRVDRAERRTGQGFRPDDATAEVFHGGRLIAAWPTKWALAPRLAAEVVAQLPPADKSSSPPRLAPLRPPSIAPNPWKEATWTAHRDVHSGGPA